MEETAKGREWTDAMQRLQPRCCGLLPSRPRAAFPLFDKAATLYSMWGQTENEADALLMGALCRQRAAIHLDTADRKLREARRLYGNSGRESVIRALFARMTMH